MQDKLFKENLQKEFYDTQMEKSLSHKPKINKKSKEMLAKKQFVLPPSGGTVYERLYDKKDYTIQKSGGHSTFDDEKHSNF